MSQHEALARSRAYALFGQLFLCGLTPSLQRHVERVPGLATALPDVFDVDSAAADYQHLFGFNVFPYASVMLESEGRLGGVVSGQVQRQFQQAGFTPDLSREGADHIGHELLFLAFLTGAEADAWEDDVASEAQRIRRIQHRFLDIHLLWWLPVLVQAVRQHDDPFYATLADLTLELSVDHRVALEGTGHGEVFTSSLPEPPDLLSQASAGLKDIAAYLTTPIWSGLYLSRDDIAWLGRAEQLPRGFGGRALMLTNLLRSAASYDQMTPLLDGLLAVARDWRTHYTTLADSDLSVLSRICRVWLGRLEATGQMVVHLQETATSLSS